MHKRIRGIWLSHRGLKLVPPEGCRWCHHATLTLTWNVRNNAYPGRSGVIPFPEITQHHQLPTSLLRWPDKFRRWWVRLLQWGARLINFWLSMFERLIQNRNGMNHLSMLKKQLMRAPPQIHRKIIGQGNNINNGEAAIPQGNSCSQCLNPNLIRHTGTRLHGPKIVLLQTQLLNQNILVLTGIRPGGIKVALGQIIHLGTGRTGGIGMIVGQRTRIGMTTKQNPHGAVPRKGKPHHILTIGRTGIIAMGGNPNVLGLFGILLVKGRIRQLSNLSIKDNMFVLYLFDHNSFGPTMRACPWSGAFVIGKLSKKAQLNCLSLLGKAFLWLFKEFDEFDDLSLCNCVKRENGQTFDCCVRLTIILRRAIASFEVRH